MPDSQYTRSQPMGYTYHRYSFSCSIVAARPDRFGFFLIRNNLTGLLSWADPQYLKENDWAAKERKP